MGQAKSAPNTVEEMYHEPQVVQPQVFTPLVNRKETLAMHENARRNISQKAAQRLPPRLPMRARPIVPNPARNAIMTNVKTKVQNQRKVNAASILKKAQAMNRNTNTVQGIVQQRPNNSTNYAKEINPTMRPLRPPRPLRNAPLLQRTTQNNIQTTGGRRKTRRHKK